MGYAGCDDYSRHLICLKHLLTGNRYGPVPRRHIRSLQPEPAAPAAAKSLLGSLHGFSMGCPQQPTQARGQCRGAQGALWNIPPGAWLCLTMPLAEDRRPPTFRECGTQGSHPDSPANQGRGEVAWLPCPWKCLQPGHSCPPILYPRAPWPGHLANGSTITPRPGGDSKSH